MGHNAGTSVLGALALSLFALPCIARERPKAVQPKATTAPTTRKAEQPPALTGQQIRDLMLRALHAREDPNGALQMLIRAAQAASKLKSRDEYTKTVVTYDPRKINLAHLFRAMRGKTVERKRRLSKRAVLVETVEVTYVPFTGMADNNKAFIMPVPMKGETLKRQLLQIDGNDVVSIPLTGARAGRQKEYHVSPDHRRVVLADWLQGKPMEILDVSSRTRTPVAEPKEFDGHYNVYPFRFVQWAEDSGRFSVEVTGSVVSGRGPGSELMAYREVWRIDAKTAKATFVRRQEQPWRKDLKWQEPKPLKPKTPEKD